MARTTHAATMMLRIVCRWGLQGQRAEHMHTGHGTHLPGHDGEAVKEEVGKGVGKAIELGVVAGNGPHSIHGVNVGLHLVRFRKEALHFRRRDEADDREGRVSIEYTQTEQ